MCVCFVLFFNFSYLPIYFVFISIYNVMIFAENVCVIIRYVLVYSSYVCKMHEINKTFIVCYCICIQHFLASELIVVYSDNVLVE